MKIGLQKRGKKSFKSTLNVISLNTKAFTLIELLAVIIVMAVVAIIAVPVVIDVIEDARNSANKETVYGIMNAGEYYYAESMLDENKKYNVENIQDIYGMIELDGEKPQDGKLYVNNQGQVALSVTIGKKCYVKNFYSELQELDKEDSNCDLGYVGTDETKPEVSIEPIGGIDGIITGDGWNKNEINIKVNASDSESGVAGYKWCQGIDCEPSITETENNKSIKLEDSQNTQFCVIAFDNAGYESEKVCSEIFSVDATEPEVEGVEDVTINPGEEMDLLKDVIITDVTSGVDKIEIRNEQGEIISSIDTSKTGTHIIKYIITDKAGNVKEVTRKIIISASAPNISFNVAEGIINEYGWGKEDFYVTVNVKDNTGHGIKEVYVCTSNESDRCEPTNIDSSIKDNKITRLVSIESNNNRICVKAIDNENQSSEVICSDAYKLDKTAPVVGNINVNGSVPSEDWYKEDLTITSVDGTDGLSGHLSTTVNFDSITENTEGKVVTVTTTDKAGNTSTKGFTIKLDKTEPEVEITKATNSTKLTATVTPSTTISGYSYKWYKDGNLISGEISKVYTPEETGKYKVEVTTGAGKVVTSNEITIDSYIVSYNLNGGIGSIPNTIKLKDVNTNITSTIPTKEGYTFQGWGSSTTDTTVDYLSNASYTANANKTLYAIWKKTITITFVANGATISKESVTCDMYNADTSCKVTFPTITRSGFTITGFNTDSTATTSQVASGAEKSVSANATYYAITSKQITITFYRNGATSITPKGGSASTTTSLTQTCTIRNSATNCSITSPKITAPSTTPTVLGWNTSASSTSSAWSENTSKIFTANASYYAITTKAKTTLTAKFNANGATLSSTSNLTCDLAATYNGAAQATSCTVTAPTITRSGFTITGYNTSASSTTNNSAYNTSTRALTLTTSNNNSTWYAITSKLVTVTYSANGGSGSMTSSTCTIQNSATNCPITLKSNGFTKTNYTFDGWGTTTSSVSHNAGSQYSFATDTTLNAIWKSAAICRRATTLHTEICNASNSAFYCSNAGYSTGATITYGSLGTSGTLKSGNAFDCDVNGDGVYDAETERFYYVSDLYNTTSKSFDSNYAVLIYYKNTYKVVVNAPSSSSVAYSTGTNSFGPSSAKTYLPTTTQWSNVSLSNTSRAILNELDGATTANGYSSLPTEFSYAGYAARLLTAQELNKACGITVGPNETRRLDSCNYLIENTNYSGNSTVNGYWLETPYSSHSTQVWVVGGSSRLVSLSEASSSSLGVRPVIEVLKTDIDY